MGLRLADFMTGASKVAVPGLMIEHRQKILAEREQALAKLRQKYQTGERIASQDFRTERDDIAAEAKLTADDDARGYGTKERIAGEEATSAEKVLDRKSAEKIAETRSGRLAGGYKIGNGHLIDPAGKMVPIPMNPGDILKLASDSATKEFQSQSDFDDNKKTMKEIRKEHVLQITALSESLFKPKVGAGEDGSPVIEPTEVFKKLSSATLDTYGVDISKDKKALELFNNNDKAGLYSHINSLVSNGGEDVDPEPEPKPKPKPKPEPKPEPEQKPEEAPVNVEAKKKDTNPVENFFDDVIGTVSSIPERANIEGAFRKAHPTSLSQKEFDQFVADNYPEFYKKMMRRRKSRRSNYGMADHRAEKQAKADAYYASKRSINDEIANR